MRFSVVACFLELTISIDRASCDSIYTRLLEFSKYQDYFINLENQNFVTWSLWEKFDFQKFF